MFYYSYFSITGRHALMDALKVRNPFALSPAEIVERVLHSGFMPMIDRHRRQPLSTPGHVTIVRRYGQNFRVVVSVTSEQIAVEETRTDRYDPVE